MHKVQRARAPDREKLSPAERVLRTRARQRQDAGANKEYLLGFTDELKQLSNQCETSLNFSLKTITAIARRSATCDTLRNHYGLNQLIREITEDVGTAFAEIDSIKRALKNSTLGNLRRRGADAISTLFAIFDRLAALGEIIQTKLMASTLDCYDIMEQYELSFPVDKSARQEINQILEQFEELGDSLKSSKRSA